METERIVTEMKEERSRLKARLTTATKRLSSNSQTNLEQSRNELEDIYQELLTVHFQYSEMVEHDDTFSSYRTVSGLNLNEYLENIEGIYKGAIKSCFHHLAEHVETYIKTADVILSSYENGECDKELFIYKAELHLTNSVALLDFSAYHKDFDLSNLHDCIFKLRQAIKVGKCDLTCDQYFGQTKSPQPQPRISRVSFDTQELGGGIAQSTSFSPSLESRNNNLAGYRSASQGRLSNFDTSVVSAYKNGSSKASGYPLPDLNSDENSELSSGSTFRKSKFIKVPLPTFSGDRRAWVDFRSIWRKHAEREYDDDIERAWALKSCLKDKALDVVKPILVTQEGAYARMWNRLDEIYCDVSLNIQCVHSDLKS
ncbi:hypothetical protein EB796_009582 [Bugula neritina]|uniref:Uncharacterized protein n=1 Tax=Bugula neritina TaxID=10212 RepID=A0A7J7K0D6_BUGNE|nr:hypothetical protein EB796_009582 [Bugula neritina]